MSVPAGSGSDPLTPWTQPSAIPVTTATVRCVPRSTGEHWMSTAEAAAHLGVKLRTLYRLIDEGEIPAYKLGRLIRLRTAEVEAYGRDDDGDDEAAEGPT